MRLLVRMVAVALVVTATDAGFAQEVSSAYSSVATAKCKKVDGAKEGEGEWSVWLCPGIGGYVVRMTEDDLRLTVSVARNLKAAADQPAAKHQFPSFNNVHDTVEWRMAKGQPFATIQRWFFIEPEKIDKDGRPTAVGMLIVTRLNPACHAAYVDVAANGGADANVLARQAADEHARGFDCKQKPIVIGKRGRAIALAMP